MNNLLAKEMIVGCYGIFWLFENDDIMWLSKNGIVNCKFDLLDDTVKEYLKKERKTVWASEKNQVTLCE